MRLSLQPAVIALALVACSVKPMTYTPEAPDAGVPSPPPPDAEPAPPPPAPTCSDGIKNGDESAADCGGSCGACSDGLACLIGHDCRSGVCANATCQAAACTDRIKNGDESDVDCGGATCGGCNVDQACGSDVDCVSDGICDALRCRSAQSCAEIHAHHPNAGDGVYAIAPPGLSAPFGAVCDMTRDGGGWTLLLKSIGDATLSYNAALWTDDVLLAADDLTTAPGNAKYPAFLSLPIASLRGELDGFSFAQAIATAATARAIFSGPPITVDTFPTFNTGAANWSAQPNCHTFGVNVPYATGPRFGWSANQEDQCLSNDTGIGLGVNAYGAGYRCTSSECSAGNVDVGGIGRLWGR